MAALDFPASPTNGQVYANWIYSTSKGAWQAKPITGKVTTSAVAPSAPTNGDEWFNTNDGNLYVYYTDVDGSQWVQVKSDATLSSTLGNRVTTLETYPAGLVPIVPTSITVGTGTSSVNNNGLITFTGVSSVSINGCFTSTFANYHIQVYQALSSVDGTGISLRYRASGVDTTTPYYQAGYTSPNSTGAQNNWGTGSATGIDLGRLRTSTAGMFGENIYSFAPAVSTRNTLTTYNGWWENSSSGYFITAGATLNTTAAYDGFTLFPGSGNMTGFVQVYGMR